MVGKSTLLKLILDEFSPTMGSIQAEGRLGFVPQNPIFPPDATVARFLECEEKINALHRIIAGSMHEKDLSQAIKRETKDNKNVMMLRG